MQIYQTSEVSPEVAQAKQRLGVVGTTPALNQAIQRAITVAPIDLSVLITGESGTGKEFFPKIIHQFSARKHAKYIAVNCGAIPEGTIDSELFGHVKGAFTGAVSERKGYFEEADGGTIFLDEVAELPLTTQARLLRVLESGEFIRVGSSEVQKTNIRVVAATNVDMARAVAEGRFREDLYYRLSTVNISIPPLRDRGNDIMLLARKFAADFGERHRRPRITLSEEAQRALLAYRWPGNVRQLKNVVEQMSLFEAGTEISYETLRGYLPADAPSVASGPATQPTVRTNTYEREREMLFGLIFSLQNEIADLRSQIDQMQPADKAQISIGRPMTTAVAKITQPDHSAQIIDIDPVETTEATDAATHQAAPAVMSPDTLEEAERESIRRALERNDGRRRNAAAELGISERTLYRKIKEYGLE